MKSEQCFFVRLCSFVSFRMIMLCFAKYETYETGFRMQGVFFREIRNSFCMKFSRILYERNSSVNPSAYVLGAIAASTISVFDVACVCEGCCCKF